MENRAEKSGIAAETFAKMQSKYDPELSHQILEWINEVLGDLDISTDGSEDNFHEVLKNGTILCRLANKMVPDAIPRFAVNPKLPFKCIDNISIFLKSLDKFQIPMQDRFQTVDLWERISLYSVQICLAAMARKANKFGLKGFGPKEAEENKRTFTEEQLRQGETIINLQYGTNKHADTHGALNFGKINRM